jgi:hypothetical protein
MAGFTKGAIYSIFSSKQDLVLELLTGQIANYVNRYRRRPLDPPAPHQFMDPLVTHPAEEITKEAAWRALIAEPTAKAAIDQALKELRQVISEKYRSTFAALLISSGLVGTAQEASTTACITLDTSRIKVTAPVTRTLRRIPRRGQDQQPVVIPVIED